MTSHHRLDSVVDRPAEPRLEHGRSSTSAGALTLAGADRTGSARPLSGIEVVAVSDNSSDRSAMSMFGALTGIATLSAVLVVGGAGLGLLIDDWTSAPHVFVFLGLALGAVAAVLATRSIIRRFFR